MKTNKEYRRQLPLLLLGAVLTAFPLICPQFGILEWGSMIPLLYGLYRLAESGHLTLRDHLYSITDKGLQHSAITESSLPYSVRLKSEKSLVEVNAKLRRAAQIRSRMEHRADGLSTVHLELDDNEGNLFSLSLMVGDETYGKQIMDRFQAAPDKIYNDLLTVLLPEEND